ncbi:MAG: TIGR03960 family B12-binding radical SAM protein [Cellulosilyticum sp.]|nr:TIGR03960 family B12-binding radical SAM protein [Cellulosilyticum sp.]
MSVVELTDALLSRVDKPARYIGGELNSANKVITPEMIRVAFAFPDVYEVGMSHLGMQILYHFFNRREDVFCERVFAPWTDMEAEMRKEQVPLFALETHTPLKEFDFLAFTLQYEMCYTNVLNMLDLAGIPIFSKERTEEDPIVIAGGCCTYNPETLAPFVDIFYIGEGEVSYDELFDRYQEWKAKGGTREEFLIECLKIPGLYIPRFYEIQYNEDGTIKERISLHPDAPATIRKVIVTNVDEAFYQETQVIPWIQAVHDRATLEMFRGCIRGCRFCQAGMIYRPVRQKSKEVLLDQAKKLLSSTGYDEISLCSLSTSDYEELEPFTNDLMDLCKDKKVNISLPSLRVDAFSVDLMQKVQEVRKSSLTFAPEAGTQKQRDVINKNITEEEILRGCKLAFEGGWNRVKLYFMLGLPYEEASDIVGIAELGDKIVQTYFGIDKAVRAPGLQLTISTSCFVPKPFTPFQWAPQDTADSFIEKIKLLKGSITRKQIRYIHHDAKTSVLEAVIARGDQKVAELIYRAYKKGCTFDSWSEYFKHDKWIEAAEEMGLSFDFYAKRERSYEEVLPWDHIDIGVTKRFLMRENELAKKAATSPNCHEKCSGCGASRFGKGLCHES